MQMSEANTLTVAEAARHLDIGVEALLELVYREAITATVQRETGRILLDERDVERWRTQRAVPGSR